MSSCVLWKHLLVNFAELLIVRSLAVPPITQLTRILSSRSSKPDV